LLQKKISKANSKLTVKHTELAALSSKVICLQKTLNQTDHHASQKADCLAAELDNDNNETKNENNPSMLSQLIDSMSSFF